MIGNPGKVEHDPIALGILATYALVGVLIYIFYGYRHSKLGIAASTSA